MSGASQASGGRSKETLAITLSPKLLRDFLRPRIDIRPLAVVARVPTKSFEQEPPPCGPVIEINDSAKTR
jgi:hypothetical protein